MSKFYLALFTVFLSFSMPALGAAAEDCITIDRAFLRARQTPSGWELFDGGHSLWPLKFGNDEKAARLAAQKLLALGAEKYCMAGRPWSYPCQTGHKVNLKLAA